MLFISCIFSIESSDLISPVITPPLPTLNSLWEGSGLEATEEQQKLIPPIIGEETITGSQEATVLTTVYAPIPPDTRMMLPATPATPQPTPAPFNAPTNPPQSTVNRSAPTPTNPPVAQSLPAPTNPPVAAAGVPNPVSFSLFSVSVIHLMRLGILC